MAGPQRMERGTVLRHPAVTPMLTLTLPLSLSLPLTCTRAPLALTQSHPCGSTEETRQIPGCGRGSTGAEIVAVGEPSTVFPARTGQGCALVPCPHPTRSF